MRAASATSRDQRPRDPRRPTGRRGSDHSWAKPGGRSRIRGTGPKAVGPAGTATWGMSVIRVVRAAAHPASEYDISATNRSWLSAHQSPGVAWVRPAACCHEKDCAR